MKKLTLLIVLFLTLGLTATFALDAEPSWAGDATLTVGYDLEGGTLGFLNEYTASVELLILDAASVEAGSSDGISGMITLADATMSLSGDETTADVVTVTAPTVTATLYISPIWIQIYSEPSMDFDWAADAEGNDDGVQNDAYAGGYGFTLGGAFDPVDFEVYVVSEDDWTANANNAFAAGLKGGVAVGPVDADIYAFMGFNYAANPIGFGASADLTLPLGGMELVVGVDADIESDAALEFEVAAGTDLNLAFNDDGDPITSVNVDFSYSDAALGDADLAVGFSEASGFVDGLTFDLDVMVGQILTSTATAVDVDVSGSYDLDGIKPGFVASYDLNVLDVTDDQEFSLQIYLELGGLIPLTTFTLDYTSDQLLDAQLNEPGGLIAQNLGEVTFATKIAYE
jgi:hypothetical protein